MSNSIRDGFGTGLLQVGKQEARVVALTADLGSSVKMDDFAKAFPERFFQIGVAEQNMAGVAAGLALGGKIPYIGSFASFQPMRNLDQIRTSIAMMNLPVKIVSSHAGFSFPGDGIQIQALEDVAIMRALPNMEVYVPADAQQAAEITLAIASRPAPAYLRLGRSPAAALFDHQFVDHDIIQPLKLGQAQFLTRGGDGAIITNGYMVDNALQAAAQLALQGIHFTVINMHTVKPLDVQAIIQAAEITKRIVVVEEHQASGGLAGGVAEALAQHAPEARLKIVAVQDSFGDTASTQTELWEHFGLMPHHIVENSLALLNV
jgi:transketolase